MLRPQGSVASSGLPIRSLEGPTADRRSQVNPPSPATEAPKHLERPSPEVRHRWNFLPRVLSRYRSRSSLVSYSMPCPDRQPPRTSDAPLPATRDIPFILRIRHTRNPQCVVADHSNIRKDRATTYLLGSMIGGDRTSGKQAGTSEVVGGRNPLASVLHGITAK
jgi:hypothetical protein